MQGGCDGFSAGSLAENYALLREEGPDGSGAEWPAYVLPICTWGCGIDSCLDCSKPEVVFGRIESDESRFPDDIEETLGDARAMLVGHAHYDHLMDELMDPFFHRMVAVERRQ